MSEETANQGNDIIERMDNIIEMKERRKHQLLAFFLSECFADI